MAIKLNDSVVFEMRCEDKSTSPYVEISAFAQDVNGFGSSVTGNNKWGFKWERLEDGKVTYTQDTTQQSPTALPFQATCAAPEKFNAATVYGANIVITCKNQIDNCTNGRYRLEWQCMKTDKCVDYRADDVNRSGTETRSLHVGVVLIAGMLVGLATGSI